MVRLPLILRRDRLKPGHKFGLAAMRRMPYLNVFHTQRRQRFGCVIAHRDHGLEVEQSQHHRQELATLFKLPGAGGAVGERPIFFVRVEWVRAPDQRTESGLRNGLPNSMTAINMMYGKKQERKI